jgi:hypothetical protein
MAATFDGAESNPGTGGVIWAVDSFTDDIYTHTIPYGALAFGPSNGPYTPVNVGAAFPVNLDQLHGTTISVSSGTKDSGTLRVVLATDQPQLTNKLLVTPDSVALPANQSVNVSQMGGTATSVNSGVKDSGTQRVVLATDQPALTNKLLVTPDLPAGAATAAKQPSLGTAGTASGDVLTVQGVAGMTKLLVTADPITFSSAQAVTQSGTWTVQPGNTANTTPWLTTPTPATAGGSTPSRIKSAAGTNATSVKGSAGQLYGFYLYNNTSYPMFLKLYNKATAPTVGTDTPAFTIGIPAFGGCVHEFALGVPFGTGIGYALTGGVADADTTATAVDDVHGVLLYK